MSIEDMFAAQVEKRKAATAALANHWAKKLEAEAKQVGSWNDRTGHLRQRIHGGTEIRSDIIVIYLSHGMRYGSYFETGTGIHGPQKRAFVIKPKNKKRLKFMGAGGNAVFSKGVINPGMKARPVIEPTISRNKKEILENFKELWS